MTPPPRSTRNGFTVLELLLALALGLVVSTTALSLFWLVSSSDRRLDTKFDESIDLSFAQETLRKAMGQLVAARPVDPDENAIASQTAGGEDDEGDEGEGDDSAEAPEPEPEEPEEDEGPNARLREVITELTGDPELAAQLLGVVTDIDRPHFEIYFDSLGERGVLPVLEVVLMQSPVPPPALLEGETRSAASGATLTAVRGVFETVDLGDRLLLQWTPINPPGPPTALMDDIVAIEWWALPRARHGGEWVQLHAAYLQEDYPVAVRLVLWLRSGAHVDWLFETTVATPEAV